jgi:hypothetical protein
MSIYTFYKSLASASTRRQPIRRSPPALRPSLEVLEERCLLSFSPLVDYVVASNAGALAAVDLNGDGLIDLGPVGSGGGPGINALFGNGAGTFHQAQLPGIGTPYTPVVARLNADAIDDLVSTIPGGSSLRVQLGNGDGTYRQTQVIVLPPQLPPGIGASPTQDPTSFAVADLNADGKLDLVVAASDTEVADPGVDPRRDYYVNVLLGNGNGTFGPSRAYFFAKGTDNTYAYVLGLRDFDGDGRLDVLTTWDAVRLLPGNGDGTLQPPVGDFSGAWTTPDVNADGVLDQVDLVYDRVASGDGVDYTTRYAHVRLGHSDGSFTTPMISNLGAGYHARYALQTGFADLDGNGFPELVTREFDPYGPPFYYVCVARNDGIWTPTAPSITISDLTIAEGNTGTRMANFTVTMDGASRQAVTVAYATANGTATAGSDYQSASGTLIIPAGQTAGTVTVQVIGDRVAEQNETFVVNLSGASNATIAVGQGVCTIVDDEPRISISDVARAEGRRGQTTLFTFTVTLSATYDQSVTVSYRTVNGTAKTSDSDYVAKTGTLTFAPGETTKAITIVVNGDNKKEADETFYLELFGLSGNALFTKNRGLGTILNDD